MFNKMKQVFSLFLLCVLSGSVYADIDSLSEEELYSKLQAELPVIDHSCSVITKEQKDCNYIHIYNLKTRILELYPEWSERVKKAILDNNVEIGMTKEQVQVSWCLPNDVSVSIDKSGIHEQCNYGGSGCLYFEKGKLSCWQYKEFR